MLFNSLTFVVFFVVVVGLYQILPTWTWKKGLLLIASYLFYGAWNPPFVLLLWISTGVDWFAAKRIALSGMGTRRRRIWLLVSLAVNLGLLGYFKYGGFLLDNFCSLMTKVGWAYAPPKWDIVLPVGISFYTFQTLSYTIDVYRGRIEPSKSWLDFALYVSFFPQLVAGPIVRAANFLPQCEEERRTTGAGLSWGLFLMTLGLFQKIVLADALLAPAADAVFNSPGPAGTADTWVGVIAFAGQIFCDFAGYSTCAIGAALCLGFHLPDNFRFPYAAVGFRDFWRRWHISLSTWLRDYLYIPLGGNRHGRSRMWLALAATMLLGGLWHGASWNFVVWGALHGVYLIGERGLLTALGERAWTRTLPARLLGGAATYVLVCFGWVFFRAADLGKAAMLLASMLGLIPAAPILPTIVLLQVLCITAGLIVSHVVLRNRRLGDAIVWTPWWLSASIWAFMLIAIVLTQGAGDAFIYFQF